MQEQNEEDTAVRKKCISFDWPIWSLAVSVFTVIHTIPPHGLISPLTAFWDQRWHASSCQKHTLRPRVAAAVAHLWQRLHGACHLVWSQLQRQNPCTGQQDRAMMWAGQETCVSVTAERTSCTQWLTNEWAQPRNWWNPGGAGRGICLSPKPHVFPHQALRNRASAGKALERKQLKQ